MFYSYFNVLHNIAARRLYLRKTEGGMMRLANAAFLLWVVAPLMSELLAFRGPDDDKDETAGEWACKTLRTFPFQTLPIVRDVVNGAFGEYGYKLSPLSSSFEEMARWGGALKKAVGEDEWEPLVERTINVAGIFSFGALTRQDILALYVIYDSMNGNDVDLQNLLRKKPRR